MNGPLMEKWYGRYVSTFIVSTKRRELSMEVHEQAELERVMKQSLAGTRSLAKDKRIVKAGRAGMQYCKSNGFDAGVALNLFDEKGTITPLTGDKALAYLIAGVAFELLDAEKGEHVG
jgi:hypothetical protein